jgi:hypothetical protein
MKRLTPATLKYMGIKGDTPTPTADDLGQAANGMADLASKFSPTNQFWHDMWDEAGLTTVISTYMMDTKETKNDYVAAWMKIGRSVNDLMDACSILSGVLRDASRNASTPIGE